MKMKEYKYRINGNLYSVKIGDIDNNLAQVCLLYTSDAADE